MSLLFLTHYFIYFSTCISVRVAFFVLVAWVFLVRNKRINFYSWLAFLSKKESWKTDTDILDLFAFPGALFCGWGSFGRGCFVHRFHRDNSCLWVPIPFREQLLECSVDWHLSFHVPGGFWGCPKEPSLLLWHTMARVLWGCSLGSCDGLT